jgi:dihydroxy-acid dehydratase
MQKQRRCLLLRFREPKQEVSKRSRKTPANLRSARWFAPDDLRSFGHRSRMSLVGYAVEEFQGKPIIGIINTWSDFAQCHAISGTASAT